VLDPPWGRIESPSTGRERENGAQRHQCCSASQKRKARGDQGDLEGQESIITARTIWDSPARGSGRKGRVIRKTVGLARKGAKWSKILYIGAYGNTETIRQSSYRNQAREEMECAEKKMSLGSAVRHP